MFALLCAHVLVHTSHVHVLNATCQVLMECPRALHLSTCPTGPSPGPHVPPRAVRSGRTGSPRLRTRAKKYITICYPLARRWRASSGATASAGRAARRKGVGRPPRSPSASWRVRVETGWQSHSLSERSCRRVGATSARGLLGGSGGGDAAGAAAAWSTARFAVPRCGTHSPSLDWRSIYRVIANLRRTFLGLRRDFAQIELSQIYL